MDNTEKRTFIEAQIAGLEKPIYENTILQKAYASGGEITKPQLEQTASVLGSLIAVRESFEAELATIPTDPLA